MTIERTSTSDKVAEVLRDRIMRGDIAPGTALSEVTLASNMGVSRNTVREGIRRLSRGSPSARDTARRRRCR